MGDLAEDEVFRSATLLRQVSDRVKTLGISVGEAPDLIGEAPGEDASRAG